MLTNLEAFPPADTPTEETTPPIRKIRRVVELLSPQIAVPPPSRLQRFYLRLRRMLDFGLGLVISLLASPVILFAALAVRITSRGPAFYTQTRVGRGGNLFTIYKIRTMIHKCESLTGPRWTTPDDPRVTTFGWFLRRTHLDELPQLLNVLRGNMSLIGPRPERPEFVAKLEKSIPGYGQRHRVLPGITGLAQVQLPPDTDLDSVRRKVSYDLHYVRRVSPWLDARILAATVLHLAGMPFTRLQTMRIVPGPAVVERPAARPQPEPTPLVHRQAA